MHETVGPRNSAMTKSCMGMNKWIHLKGELCTAKICLLLLPEVVRFDDERHADLRREELLQRLQQRLDQLPLGAAHVDDDSEAALADILAERRAEREPTAGTESQTERGGGGRIKERDNKREVQRKKGQSSLKS